jgi:hypothetical protein
LNHSRDYDADESEDSIWIWSPQVQALCLFILYNFEVEQSNYY